MALSKIDGTNLITGLPAGSVLQTVQGTTNSAATITSATLTDTGLSGAITPSSTSNKILVISNSMVYASRADNTQHLDIALLRDTTNIFNPSTSSGSPPKAFDINIDGASGTYYRVIIPMCYLDSPSTTSSTTYKVQGACRTADSGTSVWQEGSMTSVITLIEIAG